MVINKITLKMLVGRVKTIRQYNRDLSLSNSEKNRMCSVYLIIYHFFLFINIFYLKNKITMSKIQFFREYNK